MDIATRLDLFLDVVRQGSYTKAAELRLMDRSSLSKQIKMLESELGTRLLNRSTRSLSLTEAGKEVLKQAESVRQTISDTHRIVESFHEKPKGLLRITCPTLFGKLYVQKAIKIFMQRYPDTDVQLDLSNKVLNVIEDRYDIAFRIGDMQDSNLVARKIADNHIAILASKSFIERHGMPETPEDLIKLPAVFFSSGGLVVNKIPIGKDPKSGEFKLWEFKGRYRVNEQELVLDSVKSGQGFGVLALYMLGDNIKKFDLVPLLTNYALPESFGALYAVYPHRSPTPLVNKFLDTFRETIGVRPVWESYIDNYENYYNKTGKS
ncbi:HTH-type transcriptional regulator DmlR [Paraglaciecola mesophila]|uniref:HTH-type transcriptional regulator DmlR n=1 Tax=Paraglaciecola mesophila TaxID=197222 RepID=A0A857JIM8_9ALTE|nr:LysR family transcriptional regulator [Paraglaciecola mesophila]QHJ10494.1 HTH-type transcriptional regulator DmlR [Paraglaciecola mesophila]